MKGRIGCHLVDLAWRLMPLSLLRSWLLDIHLDRCPDCQAKLAARDEVRLLFPGVGGFRLPAALVEEALKQAAGSEDESESRPWGRASVLLTRIYAGITTAVIIILLISFGWYFSPSGPESAAFSSNETNKTNIVSGVSLNYVCTKGQPADSFIYKTSDPKMVIIWVESRN